MEGLPPTRLDSLADNRRQVRTPMTALSEFRDELNTYCRNEAPRFLYSSWRQGLMTDETLRDVIRGVWTQAEFPRYYLQERDWLAMFHETGFVSLDAAQPTEPLTVYRGAILSTNGLGMAWSLSLEIARQHAENLRLSGFAAGAFEATIPPDAVLAIIDEIGEAGGEDEVVVNPICLCGASTPRLVEEERLDQAFKETLDVWTFTELLALLKQTFMSPCVNSPIHGQDHWRRVADVGLELVRATPGADTGVVLLFAVLHDYLRRNDDDDPEHGVRAAKLAEDLPGLVEPLGEERRRELGEALTNHDRGMTTGNPTIGCCWDADRLDLGRVGIEPDQEMMSTAAGRERARA
jgi:uncharacterized protein